MKELKGHVVVMAYGPSEGSVTASPVSQQTPSLFAYSITPPTSRFSSRRASVHVIGLVLRFITLVLCFVSALSLAVNVHRPSRRHLTQNSSSFASYPELLYCFGVAVTGFVYTCLQTFKGVCDITHRGILISEPLSDYISFIFDQAICYLLVSSSSVAIAWIQHINEDAIKTLRNNSIISVSMSFSAFLVLTLSGLLSGYKLCKRFMW
ncbi:Casparian strip membrane protein domain [Arabidopsis thaliana x Arabidopsis arenosa]|uniref:CASP-like protein n=1 Tax=Arabidopsis thaliana x Arabidopsis arenosa TaxID=1240361 RepID=A0A8T1Z1T2_9BRAS|nr:Casparian strip membrane protein domain [Arabidopsis thaliana x Arabidopsis arenosa]